MKKILVTAILLIGMSVQALVIKGGVHYTVESARDEAFSKVQYTIPMEEHAKYLTDPGFSLGKDGKPKIRKFGRKVTFFSDGWYAVYYSNKRYTYYYDEKGKLLELSYNPSNNYPKLIEKYNINGGLEAIFYKIDYDFTYVYDAQKNYLGYWSGENFYDQNGVLTLTRDY